MAGRGGARVSGFRELDAALQDLGKSTGKNVLRRVAKKRLEPMRAVAEAKAPERFGTLKRDIKVGTKLAKSQRGAGSKPDKNSIRMSMGPGQEPQAITQEFGTFKEPPQPFMRPAFDEEASKTVDGIGDDLWSEIAKAAARAAKKKAKAAAGG